MASNGSSTEVPNTAETNGATTTSWFLQHLRIVSGFFNLPMLRDVAFGIQEEEEDLEAGAEETNVQTIFKFLNREVGNPIVEKALVMIPKFPTSFYFITLPGLLALATIKLQLPPLGFPSPRLHKWFMVCVTSVLTELVASIAQFCIISAAGSNPTSLYHIIVGLGLGRIACYFVFLVSLAGP